MNIDITPTTNKLSIELGSKITWGKKLTAPLSSVAVKNIEKVALIAPQPTPMLKTELVWELIPGSPPLQRIMFHSRQGHCWSYPYAYIALIAMRSPRCIHLHSTSGEIDGITLYGIRLNDIFVSLTEHRVAMIRESDNPLVAENGMIVRDIKVLLKKSKNEEPQAE